MGKVGAFKQIPRKEPGHRSIQERVADFDEIQVQPELPVLESQASRCMNCGVPFCNSGCPLGNIIPEWNDLVSRKLYQQAFLMLSKTNNFPEFTGRICPAPCEEACVLNIEQAPVTIKVLEEQIVEYAFEQGWIKPQPPSSRTGKKVAVIGSGPAGLACAAQLNSAGHNVRVFERADRIGGLLVYGIPNFKLDKRVLDRRVALLTAEGIEFVTNANVGFSVDIEKLRADYNAVVLCGGSTKARNLDLPGRDLNGIYYALDYLRPQTKALLGDSLRSAESISAEGKNVIVLGGGDTGSDCVGTALRQGCKSVCQFELLPEPPRERTTDMPWPSWPMILRSSSSHDESRALQDGQDANWPAKIRDFSINTQAFLGEGNELKKIRAIRLEWQTGSNGRLSMKEIPGTEFEMDCELCLLALGFVHPEHEGLIEQLHLETDQRGNVKTNKDFMTSIPGFFAAGDMRKGQSLVVWAISEGRQAARCVDLFLMGRTSLPGLKIL